MLNLSYSLNAFMTKRDLTNSHSASSKCSMTLQDFSYVASIVGVGLTFATAGGTLYVLFKTLALTSRSLELNAQSIELARQGKQSDVLLHATNDSAASGK